MTGGYQENRNPRSGRCRALACKAPLLWAETTKGKRTPLDPKPSLEGNIALELRPHRPLDLAHTLTKDELDAARARGDALYTNHFATCPARKAFKR